MSEPIMIGVDHGYAAMKTTHCTFPTGLVEYEHEPYEVNRKKKKQREAER